MDFIRAEQILNTSETIEVLYRGSPVWIEGVNPGKGTARVRPLTGEGRTWEVAVEELVEASNRSR